jgi:predicted RNA-binding protein with PUA-like domain
MTTRKDIFNALRERLDEAGFVFEKEQNPHLQKRKESELKFIHPQLENKFEEDGHKVRGKKYYIKPLTDHPDCEIGLVTGKKSPLYSLSTFPKPNASDSFDDNPAWTNRDGDLALNNLLDSIKGYLGANSLNLPNRKNHWIFQGNPDQFDVDTYLKNSKRIYWSVPVKKYQNQIKIGDIVYLWRSQGKQKSASGIIARTSVIESCKPKGELDDPTYQYDELWTEQNQEKSNYKVGLLVEEYRLNPSDSMITSRDFMADPILRNSTIIKVRVGSNFPITIDEANRIDILWSIAGDEEMDEYEAKEGKILHRVHRIRERDPLLRKQFIQQFLNAHKILHCELCGLEPMHKYQSIGENLLEVHHTVPLHKLPEGISTKLEDLMLVCPNCHRALHKGDAEENLIKLRQIIQRAL